MPLASCSPLILPTNRTLQESRGTGGTSRHSSSIKSSRWRCRAGPRQSPRSFRRPSEIEAKAASAPEKKQQHPPFSVDDRAFCQR